MDKVLQFLGIVIIKDNKKRFNLWNPLGYILLLMAAILVFIVDGAIGAWQMIRNIITDSIRNR